jgi:Antitoxin ParD
MSRLTIDLTEEQHRTLKAVAALEGKSIRQYAVERLFPAESGKDQAWGELKELLGKRVDDGLASEFSSRSILDRKALRDVAG